MIEDVELADVILWIFGLWVLAVPVQYMRFIELISERNAESAFRNKYTAAMSTSIQFYDHTAHNYMRAVCEDLEMRYVDGISFYMLDFMKEEKRKDLITFYDNFFGTHDKKLQTSRLFNPITSNDFSYQPAEVVDKISTSRKILVLTDQNNKNTNLGQMIHHFTDSFQNTPEIIDLNSIHIKGACLGCIKCGYD